jgi:predicted NUDIX family NTP pyrophosphohydrolase
MPHHRVSAGILLFRHSDGGLEVLLGHPGGPLFRNRDEGVWSIPKGLVERDEALLDVALREFEEETGHPPPAGPRLDLGSIVQRGGKVVHGWAIEGDLDPAAAHSNEFEMEWPPGSGRRGRYPEIDRVTWLSPTDARQRINPAQATFVDRLEALMTGSPP